MKKKILIPLPAQDFDPTEAGVTWKILTHNDIEVTFSTPTGAPAQADTRMTSGQGLGIFSPLLMANSCGLAAYNEMKGSVEYLTPIPWSKISEPLFDGIVLPGGHAPGMKPYLESQLLQNLISDFFAAKKLVAAICHGTVLVARSQQGDGRSSLFGYKTTALLRSQELTAWALTFLWLKNYYRTYPETVQSEITRHLANPQDFITGPLPLRRDSADDIPSGFVLLDRNYISARWPGDAHGFGTTIAKILTNNLESKLVNP